MSRSLALSKCLNGGLYLLASSTLIAVPAAQAKAVVAVVTVPEATTKEDIRTAILIGASITKDAVEKANVQIQSAYFKLGAEVKLKQQALRKQAQTERERRRLNQEVRRLRSQQADLVRQLEEKDHEYAIAIRAFREGLTGLLDSSDPDEQAQLERYSRGDASALDELQISERVKRASRDAGTRAINGMKQRTIAYLFLDARDNGTKTTREALSAWLEAAAVDPDNFATWIHLSRLHLDLADPRSAASAAEKAKKIASNPIERGVALDELGESATREGQWADAVSIRAEGLNLARKNYDANPSMMTKRNVSVALVDVGDVARSLHDYEKASDAFNEALKIRREIQAELPKMQGPYRDLGGIVARVANLEGEIGLLDDARVHADEALGIYRRLSAMNPHSTEAGLDELIAYRDAGRIAAIDQRLADAQPLFETALLISRSLWNVDRSSGVYRREYASSLEAVAQLANVQSRFKDARQVADEFVEFARHEVASDPTYGLARYQLGLALFFKWQAAAGLNRSKDANAARTEATQLFEGLLQERLLPQKGANFLSLLKQDAPAL